MESEQVEKSRVRETESVPSAKEVEEHNVDHAVFRRWCPHCVKGRAETHGHRAVKKSEVEVPKVSVDYMYMSSEQDKEEEKGMPVLVMKTVRRRWLWQESFRAGCRCVRRGKVKKKCGAIGA